MPKQNFMTLKTYFKSQVLYKVTTLSTWGLMYAIQQVSQGEAEILSSLSTVQNNLKYRHIYDQKEPAFGDYR